MGARTPRAARREARFTGGGVANFFRKPYGPGWVLVGDAGYTKDPITAQGISDAFRDAERARARSMRPSPAGATSPARCPTTAGPRCAGTADL